MGLLKGRVDNHLVMLDVYGDGGFWKSSSFIYSNYWRTTTVSNIWENRPKTAKVMPRLYLFLSNYVKLWPQITLPETNILASENGSRWNTTVVSFWDILFQVLFCCSFQGDFRSKHRRWNPPFSASRVAKKSFTVANPGLRIKSPKWKENWVVVSNIFYVHPYLGKIPILTFN